LAVQTPSMTLYFDHRVVLAKSLSSKTTTRITTLIRKRATSKVPLILIKINLHRKSLCHLL
jgi:hypothetical protein